MGRVCVSVLFAERVAVGWVDVGVGGVDMGGCFTDGGDRRGGGCLTVSE